MTTVEDVQNETQVIPFTTEHETMLREIHAFMQNISNVLNQVMPMLAGLKDSPAGKMLGL